METLNDKIAAAEKYSGRDRHAPPIVDQSANAAFGLAWASRQTERPPQPEPPKPMPPSVVPG